MADAPFTGYPCFVPTMILDAPPDLVISLCGTPSSRARILHDARAAEARLAAAHARAGAPLDAVQTACAGRAADGVDDLALGHALAPAYNLPVGRVLPDKLRPRCKIQRFGVQNALRVGSKSGLLCKCRLPRTMSATIAPMAGALDGARGRLDGRAVHKTGRDLADEEVVPRLVGAQTHEARDGLAQRNVLDREAGFSRTSSRPAAVVAVASLSSTSMAVGPTSRLPCTVGVTNALAVLPGSWNTVCHTCRPPCGPSGSEISPAGP